MKIRIYGAEWCHDTARIKKLLDTMKLEYQYFDYEVNKKAEEFVLAANNNIDLTIPVIVVDNDILINPTDQEVKSAISNNLL